MAEPLKLGPWPLGLDNVHEPRHAVFQVPRPNDPPARLAHATDIELTDDGWPRTRPAAALEQWLTGGLGAWEMGGEVYVQDQSGLMRLADPHQIPVLTELTRRLAVGAYGDRTFLSDGTTHREMDSAGVLRPWGLPIPTLSLASTAGSTFAPGIYIVQASFGDGRNEGGTSAIAAISLSGAAGISVTVSGQTDACTHVNLYVGKDKQRVTNFAAQVLLTTTPQTIALVPPTTVNDPPKTERMFGPVSGLSGTAGWRAFNLIWAGNTVWRSEGNQPHLYHMDDFYQFPGTVQGVAPLNEGAWVGTTRGLCWLTGDEPPFIWTSRTFEPVLKGCAVVDSGLFPWLRTEGQIAVFICAKGFVFGMPSGEAVYATQQRYHVDLATYSEAEFSLVQRSDVNQLLVRLG